MSTLEKLQNEVEELVKLANEIKERAQKRLEQYEAEKAKDDEALKPLEKKIISISYTIEVVMNDRKERDSAIKEVLDDLYLASEDKETVTDEITNAYKSLGIECDFTQELESVDDAIQTLSEVASTG